MTLSERLSEYVRAAFSGVWVQSHEHDDAIAEIASLCRQNDWTLAAWDIDRGIAPNGQANDSGGVPSANDPLSAIKALNSMASPDGTARDPEVPGPAGGSWCRCPGPQGQ